MRKRTFEEVFRKGVISQIEDEAPIEDVPKKKLITIKPARVDEMTDEANEEANAGDIIAIDLHVNHPPLGESRMMGQEIGLESLEDDTNEAEQLPRVIKTLARMRIKPTETDTQVHNKVEPAHP